jgi:hypothetical protein
MSSELRFRNFYAKASALPILLAGCLYRYNENTTKTDIFNGHNKHLYASFLQMFSVCNCFVCVLFLPCVFIQTFKSG